MEYPGPEGNTLCGEVNILGKFMEKVPGFDWRDGAVAAEEGGNEAQGGIKMWRGLWFACIRRSQ